ncbi:MAG: sulfatase [Myxococcales bacterium]|nr:sulfatase [Myxococcota bacterium]MDW8280235.1 sulfatase [Myxococcales bacterium]
MTRSVLPPLLLASSLVPVPAGAEHHPVFDLVASRTLAHQQVRGGLLVPCGAPGFAKYNHFGRPSPSWRLHAVEDGRPVALAQTTARLDLPLSAEQAQAQRLWLRLKVQSRSSVKVTAADKTAAPVALAPGWQTVEVPLPPGSLHAGENELVLTFAQSGRFSMPGGTSLRAAAAVEWIQVGGEPPADTAAPPLVDGGRLVVPSGGGLAYYVHIPDGGALSVRGSGDGCSLAAEVTGPGTKRETFPLRLEGTPLDLSSHAGQVRRLVLAASGTCGRVLLSSAQLLRAGPAPRVSRPSKPRNVVLWLSDDTRADRFRLWNPSSRVETPVLDEFSKRATRFAVAYVQGNESRVSHGSLFTGMYPAQHKFIAHNAVLSSSLVILPEAVRPAGLYTIGHIANGYISKRWGFGDGWDFMRNHIHEGGGLKGEDLVRHAAEFILRGVGRTRPYFLYLGTIDAHVSWRAHEPWISKYDPKPYNGPFVKGCMDPQLDKIVSGELKINERDKERIFACYDSDISYNDRQFGELLKVLRQAGHEQDTMIIYTSDHGEEFWDHGRIGHGQSLRQELVHVPLWIYYPPLFPPGKVVQEGVEVLDLLPTITDALGIKTPPAVQGESLVPLAQGEGAGYPRPAIASQYELAHTMRLGRWKLWVGGSGQTRFVDGQDDPREERDLSQQEPLARRFVVDAMGLWMAYQDQWKKSRWGVASNHRPDLPADLEREPQRPK